MITEYIGLAALHFRKNTKDWVLPPKLLYLKKKKNAFRKLSIWSSWNLWAVKNSFTIFTFWLSHNLRYEIWNTQSVGSMCEGHQLLQSSGTRQEPVRDGEPPMCSELIHSLIKQSRCLLSAWQYIFSNSKKTLEISPTLKRFFFSS